MTASAGSSSRRLVAGLAAAGIAGSPAAAQEPEIVVTGRGLREAIGDAPFSTVEIDRERLAGSASGRLEEVLRDVAGFQLFRRSDSRSANPTSQGATLRGLGGNASSRLLLLLDGVPQADPFGGWVSWPAYDPDRLGSARVTRGGGSGVHGPGALAGTIELESAGPEDLRGMRGAVAYGSRDSLDAHAGLGLRLGGGFLSLAGGWQRGDGFVPVVRAQRGPVDRPAPYSQSSLAVRALAPLGATELQASAFAFTDERERGTPFSDIATRGADASLRLVGARWSALAYVQTRDLYNSFASVGAGRATAVRTSEQYSVPSAAVGGRVEVRPRVGAAELRLGADARETTGETRELFAFAGGSATRSRVAGGRTRTLGGFAEAAWRRGGLTLTAGGRLDHWAIADGRIEERTVATAAPLTDTRFGDRSGWEPTGRAGLALQATDDVRLRAAAYLGWRLPTLNELYRPFRVGIDATAANAELAPERLAGAEAGLDWRPATETRIGITLFANRLEGAIANVTQARGPGTFPGVGFVAAGGDYRRRLNLEAITSRGVEVDVAQSIGAWTLSGGWAFADARVRASGMAGPLNGLRPAQTPRHSLSSTLAWDGALGRASLTGRYAGPQFEDDFNRQRLPSALTVDIAAAVTLGAALDLEVRGENVTGTRVVAGITGEEIVERATPRTLWVGLRWRGLP